MSLCVLGILAIVGCGNAAARLRTGDLVLVDGGQGIVKILAHAEPAPDYA